MNKPQSVSAAFDRKLVRLNKAANEIKANVDKQVTPTEPTQSAASSFLDSQLAEMAQRKQASDQFFKEYNYRNENAWANDEELNTLTGATANTVNAAGQGGARIVGNFASLNDNLNADTLLSKLSDDARVAMQKEINGEPLDAKDTAALEEKVNIAPEYKPNTASALSGIAPEAPTDDFVTAREAYQKFVSTQESAQETKDYFTKDTFLTKGFNSLNRQNLTEDLDGAWEKLGPALSDANGVFDTSAALLNLTGAGLKALWDNPGAAIEYAAESAPNAVAAVNPLTAAANTAAYSSDVQAQNLRDKTKEGKVVSKAKQNELTQEAVLAGGLEYLGNATLASVSGLKGLAKSGKKAAEKTTEAAKDGLLKSTTKRAFKTTVSGITEGGTEGIQTAIEGDAFGEDFDLAKDGKDVFTGAVIGLGASTATVAPAQVGGQVKDTLKAASEALSDGADEVNKKMGKKAKRAQTKKITKSLEAAIESDNYTAFVEESIDTTEGSQKLDLKKKLNTIAALHAKQVKSDKPDVKKADDLEFAYMLTVQAGTDKAIELTKKYEAETNSKKKKALKKQLIDLQLGLDGNKEQLNVIQANQQKLVNTNEVVERAKDSTQRDEQFEVDAQRILRTTAVNPEAVTTEQMELLIKSSNFTQEETAQLQAALTSKVARESVLGAEPVKGSGQVHGEVILGGPGKLGSDQYRQAVVSSLMGNNPEKATEFRNQLETFAKRHAAKARVFGLAFAPFKRKQADPANIQMSEKEAKALAFVQDKSNFQTARGGAYKIDQRSKKLVEMMAIEAAALEATLSEVDSLISNQDQIKANLTAPATNEATVTEEVSEQVAETTPEVSTPTEVTSSNESQDGIPTWVTENVPDNAETVAAAPVSDDTTAPLNGNKVKSKSKFIGINHRKSNGEPPTNDQKEVIGIALNAWKKDDLAAAISNAFRGGNDLLGNVFNLAFNTSKDATTPEKTSAIKVLVHNTPLEYSENSQELQDHLIDSIIQKYGEVFIEEALNNSRRKNEEKRTVKTLKDSLAKQSLALESKDSGNSSTDTSSRAKAVFNKINNKDSKATHHNFNDDLFNHMYESALKGSYTLRYKGKEVSIPFSMEDFSSVIEAYEKNLADWKQFNESGLNTNDSSNIGNSPSPINLSAITTLADDLQNKIVKKADNVEDIVSVSHGDVFTAGIIKNPKGKGEKYTNLNYCDSCSSKVSTVLKAAGLLSKVISMGQKDFSKATDRVGDHKVAITQVNGKRYIVDHPQNELFDPLSPPEPNTGTFTSDNYTPKFILVTAANLRESYGLSEIDSVNTYYYIMNTDIQSIPKNSLGISNDLIKSKTFKEKQQLRSTLRKRQVDYYNNEDGNYGTVPSVTETAEGQTAQPTEGLAPTQESAATRITNEATSELDAATQEVESRSSEITSIKEELATTKNKKRKVTLRRNLKNARAKFKEAKSKVSSLKRTISSSVPSKEVLDINPNSIFNTWFSGKKGKGLFGTVVDVINKLREDPSIADSYTRNGDPLTAQQTAAIEDFTNFAELFGDNSDNIFKGKEERFILKDGEYQGFLAKEGKLVDSVKAAMASAAYNWLVTDATGTLAQTKEAIAKALGVGVQDISNDVFREYTNKGINNALISESLGSSVLNSLGLQPNKESVSSQDLGKLRQAIGNFVISNLADMGYVVSEGVLSTDLDSIAGSKKLDADVRAVTRYIRVATSSDTGSPFDIINPELKKIIEVNRNTDRIIGRISDSEAVTKEPSLKPITAVTKVQKRTMRKLSTKIQNILKKAQSRPWNLSEGTDKTFSTFTIEEQYEMAGVVDLDGLAKLANNNRTVQEAKNAALMQEVDNYNEWRNTLSNAEEGLTSPFYLANEVSKNQRIGYVGSLINPQTSSKVHRGLVGLSQWITKIKLSDKKSVDKFLLGIAQGLDVKAKIGTDKLGVDKLTTQTALEALNNLLETNPLFNDAAEATVRLNYYADQDVDSLPADVRAEFHADRKLVMEAVKAGGEGTHTLLALNNLGRYLDAAANGSDSFTSDMWYEIDGVTNGPIIGMLQFMNGSVSYMKSLLEKGGIFFDEKRSYGEFKESGELDLYETLLGHWKDFLRSTGRNLDMSVPADVLRKKRLIVINRIFGDLNRNSAKDPLMTNVYGAGKNSITDNLADAFFSKVEGKIEDIVNSNMPEAEKNAELAKLNGSLAILSGTGKAYQFTANSQDALLAPIDKKSYENIRAVVAAEYGDPLIEAIDAMFEDFKENRSKYNAQLQKLNKTYIAVLKSRISVRAKELIAAGSIENERDIPQAEIELINEELQALVPGLKTSFSTAADEQLEIGKSEGYSEHDSGVLTSFSRKLNNVTTTSISKENRAYVTGTSSVRSKASLSRYKADLGVRGAILYIHSLDSTVALGALNNFNALNVHDGFPVGVLEAVDLAKNLNKVFATVMAIRNPYKELGEYATKAADSLGKLISEGKVLDPGNKLMRGLIGIRQEASSLDGNTAADRKQLNEDMTYSTQYNLEEGGFEVSNLPKPTQQATAAPVQAQVVNPEPTSIWGKLSKVTAVGGAETSIKEASTAKELFTKFLVGYSDNHKVLSNQIRDILPDDVKVELIEPNSPSTGNAELDTVLKESHGAYDASSNTIYLKSSKFVNNAMNSETILHEAVHALTSRIINRVQAGSTTDKAAINAVAALEDLMKRTQASFDKKGMQYNPEAFRNIKEFIAYGMTNMDFQKQLKTVTLKNKFKDTLVNGLTSFVQAINKTLFGRSTVKGETSLKQLIELTAEVLESQKKAETAPQGVQPNGLVDAQRIEKMSSQEVLSALDKGERSSTHVDHLSNLQDNLINSISGVAGATLFEAEQNLGDEVDQYLNHLAKKTSPFVSGVEQLFNSDMTEQEAYVTQQLEVTLASDLMKGGFNAERLHKLWTQAKGVLTVEDFQDSPGQDPAIAQARYDFIFNAASNRETSEYDTNVGKMIVKTKSDYLQRFAILGSTYAPLREKLAKIEPSTETSTNENSFIKKLQTVIETIIAKVRDLFESNVTPVGNLANQMDTLMNNMATVNQRTKRKVERSLESKGTLIERVNDKVADILKTGFSKFAKAYDKSENPYVNAAGNIAGAIAEKAVESTMEAVYKIRGEVSDKRHGMLMEIIEEMRGITANNLSMANLGRFANRDIEQNRRKVKEWLKGLVEESFIIDPKTKKGKLTEEQQKSATKVLLNGDIQSILDRYGLDSIDTFLSDPKALAAEIKSLESALMDFEYGMTYINQSEFLGLYMATGKGKRTMVKNAYGIAHMFGQNKVSVSGTTANLAIPTIEALASLRSLEYMNQGDKDTVVEVMRTQANRDDGINGIEFMLRQHTALKNQALKDNFGNDPSLMQKGFTSEITNPHLTVEWAEINSPEGKALFKKGYKPVFRTKRDGKLDPDRAVTMFIREDGGMIRRVTGVASFTSKALKGTSFVEASKQLGREGSELQYNSRLDKMKRQVEQEYTDLNKKRIRPSNNNNSELIPVFNPMGDLVNFRYEMSEMAREMYLEKSYNVGDILGTMGGNIVDKVATESINNQMVDVLHQQFSEDPHNTRGGYLAISGNSNDPELREIWALLPFEAKERAREKFGEPQIMIKKELLTMTFGYRKASVASLWDKDTDVSSVGVIKDAFTKEGRKFNKLNELSLMEHMLRMALEQTVGKVLGDKLQLRIKQFGDIETALVTAVKDIYVVKNVFTTLGNIISNVALLNLSGVPMLDIIRDQAVAWKGAQVYNKHQKRIFDLENQKTLFNPVGSELNKINQELAVLKHKLANNPVHELMEAGMFQTIVEDIDATIDPYSYKSKASKWMDDKVGSKVNDKVKTLGKYLLITQDTAAYKFLNHPIQLSDFSARYVQFKYLTETKSEPLSKEDAFTAITENFINYDIPTNKNLQWLNDVGLVMFTKYFLRIQKPVLQLFRDNPVNGLLSLMAQNYMNFSSPADSSFLSSSPLSRIHNPFGNMLDAPDEIATINGIFHLTGIK